MMPFPGMIDNAVGFIVEWVHLVLDFILSLHVAGAADVEVFVQQLLASITMHVHSGELFVAKLAEEVACAISVKAKQSS